MRHFFYGTLMDRAVLNLVLGHAIRKKDMQVARLRGYARVRVAGRTYPVVVLSRDGSVTGMTVRGLSGADEARLAAYEGAGYVLREYEVEGRFGRAAARVFVPAKGAYQPLREEWDIAAWRRRHRRQFLARLRQALRTRPLMYRVPSVLERRGGKRA